MMNSYDRYLQEESEKYRAAEDHATTIGFLIEEIDAEIKHNAELFYAGKLSYEELHTVQKPLCDQLKKLQEEE